MAKTYYYHPNTVGVFRKWPICSNYSLQYAMNRLSGAGRTLFMILNKRGFTYFLVGVDPGGVDTLSIRRQAVFNGLPDHLFFPALMEIARLFTEDNIEWCN